MARPGGSIAAACPEREGTKIQAEQVRAAVVVVIAKIEGDHALGTGARLEVREERRSDAAPLTARVDDQRVQLPAMGIGTKSADPANQLLLVHGREAEPLRVVAESIDLGLGFVRSLKARGQVGERLTEHPSGCGALALRESGNVAKGEGHGGSHGRC